jgi:hypothetical protein
MIAQNFSSNSSASTGLHGGSTAVKEVLNELATQLRAIRALDLQALARKELEALQTLLKELIEMMLKLVHEYSGLHCELEQVEVSPALAKSSGWDMTYSGL